MIRVLAWLAAFVERPSIKGLQAVSTLLGWAFGGTVLLLALLLWSGVVRIEPTLARPTTGSDEDRRTAEAAMLRAQAALEAKARTDCQPLRKPNEQWAEGYVDVRDALDQADDLEGMLDDILRLSPDTAHTLGWRIAVGWRFADHVEARLSERDADERDAIRHYACAALLERSPLEMGIDSVMLTRITREDPGEFDVAEADEDDPCTPRRELRAFVHAVAHEPATLDIVLPWDRRIRGPVVPMLPTTAAEDDATGQLLHQAEHVIAEGHAGCTPPDDAGPPAAALPDTILVDLQRSLRGQGELIQDIHTAVMGGEACADAIDATRARRLAALAYGLRATPDCGAVSPDGWVSMRPASTDGDLGDVSLQMRCADICGGCPTPALPSTTLALRVASAPFASCTDTAADTLPALFGTLGQRLAGRAAVGTAFDHLGVVGWANHLGPCEGETNLGIAAARATAMAAAIRAGAGDDAARVRVSAQVQDAESCPVAHGRGAKKTRDAHEPWRRVDIEFSGEGLDFDPQACDARTW